jgi:hypothetical protein
MEISATKTKKLRLGKLLMENMLPYEKLKLMIKLKYIIAIN